MVCDLCNDHNTTLALLCKTALPEHLNINFKPYLRCEKCKHYLYKRFITLSIKHNLPEIIYHYNIKDIKPHLKTTITLRQLNKTTLGYIRYITCSLKYYTGGKFYDKYVIQYKNECEQRLRNMRGQHHTRLTDFFIDFYEELCNKKWQKKTPILWKNTY